MPGRTPRDCANKFESLDPVANGFKMIAESEEEVLRRLAEPTVGSTVATDGVGDQQADGAAGVQQNGRAGGQAGQTQEAHNSAGEES